MGSKREVLHTRTHLCEFAIAATQSSDDKRKFKKIRQFTRRKKMKGYPWVCILTDGAYLTEIIWCVYIYIFTYICYMYI